MEQKFRNDERLKSNSCYILIKPSPNALVCLGLNQSALDFYSLAAACMKTVSESYVLIVMNCPSNVGFLVNAIIGCHKYWHRSVHMRHQLAAVFNKKTKKLVSFLTLRRRHGLKMAVFLFAG